MSIHTDLSFSVSSISPKNLVATARSASSGHDWKQKNVESDASIDSKSLNLKPVDGATIDNSRKLPYPVPEAVSNGAHGQHHVQLFSDNLNEEVKQRNWTTVGLHRFIPLPVQLPHLLAQLDSFLGGEQIRYFPRIQQIADVLQKRLFFNLSVREKEHCVLVGGAGLAQNYFDILAPFV